MKDIRTISLSQGIFSQLQIKATLVALIASVAFPYLVHLFPPVQGTPVGSIVLAMFYAPLLAVLFSRYHVALIVAIFAPALNALIIGMPGLAMVPVLTFELILFVSIVHLLNKHTNVKWFGAALAFLAAKFVSAMTIGLFPVVLNANPVDYWTSSVITGIVGIIILTIMNFLAIRHK